jgi:hypothetical protein
MESIGRESDHKHKEQLNNEYVKVIKEKMGEMIAERKAKRIAEIS